MFLVRDPSPASDKADITAHVWIRVPSRILLDVRPPQMILASVPPEVGISRYFTSHYYSSKEAEHTKVLSVSTNVNSK